MNELILPVLKNLPRNTKRLSMDAYLEFLEFNLRYVIPPRVRRALSSQRKRKTIKVQFRIK